MTAVDYSAARFTAAQLKAAGVVAVGRYLTGPYAITISELLGLLAGGIVVWFIFEVGVNNVSAGYAQGVADARAADNALVALGLPVDQPVYFTVDENLQSPGLAVPYFQGIDSVRPAADTGDYAEGAVCQALENAGLVGFNWQSMSKAFPGNAVTLPITDIQQEPSGAPLPDTDLDVLLKSDFGQYPRPVVTPPPPPPVVYPGDNMKATPISVYIAGGKGWYPSPVPAASVVNVEFLTTNPDDTGTYATLPTYTGLATEAGSHSPDGGLTFSGPDGTWGAVVWSAE